MVHKLASYGRSKGLEPNNNHIQVKNFPIVANIYSKKLEKVALQARARDNLAIVLYAYKWCTFFTTDF